MSLRDEIASYLYRAEGGALSGGFVRAQQFVKANPYSETAACIQFAYEQADHILALVAGRAALEQGADLCPNCGGTHPGRYEGACAGPPVPSALPPHKMMG